MRCGVGAASLFLEGPHSHHLTTSTWCSSSHSSTLLCEQASRPAAGSFAIRGLPRAALRSGAAATGGGASDDDAVPHRRQRAAATGSQRRGARSIDQDRRAPGSSALQRGEQEESSMVLALSSWVHVAHSAPRSEERSCALAGSKLPTSFPRRAPRCGTFAGLALCVIWTTPQEASCSAAGPGRLRLQARLRASPPWRRCSPQGRAERALALKVSTAKGRARQERRRSTGAHPHTAAGAAVVYGQPAQGAACVGSAPLGCEPRPPRCTHCTLAGCGGVWMGTLMLRTRAQAASLSTRGAAMHFFYTPQPFAAGLRAVDPADLGERHTHTRAGRAHGGAGSRQCATALAVLGLPSTVQAKMQAASLSVRRRGARAPNPACVCGAQGAAQPRGSLLLAAVDGSGGCSAPSRRPSLWPGPRCVGGGRFVAGPGGGAAARSSRTSHLQWRPPPPQHVLKQRRQGGDARRRAWSRRRPGPAAEEEEAWP